MDMINVPVTLIVKAPNQQIEDQTIKCEPSWSIRKLKGYLAEVYPSKPRTEDQKLIYSGQLLSDTVILKDVLRKYDGQETHTVHLVCSSSRESLSQRSSPMTSKSIPRMNETTRDSAATLPHGGEAQSSATPDGLRQRLSTTNSSPCNVPMTTPSAIPPADPRAAWAAAMAQPYDPNNVAHQLMYMQQAYIQYMSQYMQMLATQQPTVVPQPQPPAPQSIPEQPAVEHDPNEPPPEEEELDLHAEPPDEDDPENRDWLDWFYILSRVMVLFSIVYFYSSPTRFVLVSAIGMMMYLRYQVGVFRAQQLQPMNEAENDDHAMDARRIDNNNIQNIQRDDAPANNPEAEQPNEGEEGEEERPSMLAVTWTFFSTFFASLLPEPRRI